MERAESLNYDENLLLRQTQTELLEKLNRLQQWRQKQEECLLLDKEKQLNLLRDKERRLHAVQTYQRKILQNNNFMLRKTNESSSIINIPTIPSQLVPSPQIRSPTDGLSKDSVYIEMANSPTKNVLLPPQLFDKSSPVWPKNQMLLTQKELLQPASDDDLSQCTESEVGSVGKIEGVHPISDTASDASDGNDVEDWQRPILHYNISNRYNNDEVIGNNNQSIGEDSGSIGDSTHSVDDDNQCAGDIILLNGDKDQITRSHIQCAGDDQSKPFVNGSLGDNFDVMEVDDEKCYSVGTNSHNDNNHGISYNYNTNFEMLQNHSIQMKHTPFDDIPIKPGLGEQVKTFEELLSQKLVLEKEDVVETESTRCVEASSVPAKRSFLKRGKELQDLE